MEKKKAEAKQKEHSIVYQAEWFVDDVLELRPDWTRQQASEFLALSQQAFRKGLDWHLGEEGCGREVLLNLIEEEIEDAEKDKR